MRANSRMPRPSGSPNGATEASEGLPARRVALEVRRRTKPALKGRQPKSALMQGGGEGIAIHPSLNRSRRLPLLRRSGSGEGEVDTGVKIAPKGRNFTAKGEGMLVPAALVNAAKTQSAEGAR